MGQSGGVLLKKVAVFRRCPLVKASLYMSDTVPVLS